MSAILTCRQLSETVGILLHTIICERRIYEEIYARPAKRLGIRYPMCWEERAENYICKLEQHVRSFLRVQSILKISFNIFRPWPYTYELKESWNFVLSTPEDSNEEEGIENVETQIQATVDQIRASASFLPPLEPGHVFKVLFYAEAELNPSTQKFLVVEEPRTEKPIDSIKFRPIQGECMLELEMNAALG